jgi:polysaccharide deacetylase family protein (PEP-CTERM system associated)
MSEPAAGKAANILTFDVEDLDAMNFASMDAHRGKTVESRVAQNMETILALLDRFQAKATMFFLGPVAEKHPALVKRAHAEGHEIASHGYAHELVYRQTPDQFREDVKRSADILRQLTGRPVIGYRAPSWSISRQTPWAYEILADLGFVYDASLFPFKTFLYGDSEAPLTPFAHPCGSRLLYEVPATVLTLCGRRIPFGGGFYLRAMPWLATRLATFITHRRGRAVVFYLHPREIDPHQPRFDLPWRDRIIAYANLGTTLEKLRRVLTLGGTSGVYEYLQGCFPAAAAAAPLSQPPMRAAA